MDKSILESMVNQGLSTHQMAKSLNYSQTNVMHWLRKFGLKTNKYSFKNGYWLNAPQTPQMIENGIEYRECSSCNKKKILLKDFYNRNDKKSHHWCKKCFNKKTVKCQQERKAEAVSYKGGKCVKCGYNKYLGALDFHHLDPSTKDFSISNYANCSIERIKSELDKCILLCRNCHAETHFEMRNKGI